MSLQIGQAAPLFEARSDDGRVIRLQDYLGQWVILFFYPRASSAGCSIEAQAFETNLPEFKQLGATVIGISTDTEASQAKFRHSCDLSYPLIPDSDKAISRAYEVMGGLGGLLGLTSRTTYLIAPDGTVYSKFGHLNPKAHIAHALAQLKQAEAKA